MRAGFQSKGAAQFIAQAEHQQEHSFHLMDLKVAHKILQQETEALEWLAPEPLGLHREVLQGFTANPEGLGTVIGNYELGDLKSIIVMEDGVQCKRDEKILEGRVANAFYFHLLGSLCILPLGIVPSKIPS